MRADKTAVIFFSRTQVSESQSKIFDPSFYVNAKITSAIISRSLKTLRKTGLDIIYYNEYLQEAELFGENIVGAFQYGFDQGYDQLILVGNDCVELSASDVLNASDQIKKSDIVLGPDYRGGLYLIGLNRNSFEKNKSNFQQLSWRQQNLWRDCVFAFPEFCELRRLHDINSLHDLRKFILTNQSSFSRTIRTLLSSKGSLKVGFLSPNSTYVKLSPQWRRGPPEVLT
ncbi:MAG: DUF2064 domain-containing protein [Fluviicola sp.]